MMKFAWQIMKMSEKFSTHKKPIYDITPFSMLDYPNCLSAIIWFAGCNYRCHYCYNPHIVFGDGNISEQEALEFLKTRIGLLDAVVLSGGEATLHYNLKNFITQIKNMGFAVKLDTNGSRPLVIKDLLDANLLDYVAIDFKAPPSKFFAVTQAYGFDYLLQTIAVVINSKINYEIRITYHSDLMSLDDLKEIANITTSLGHKGILFVQNAIQADTISSLGVNSFIKQINQNFIIRN